MSKIKVLKDVALLSDEVKLAEIQAILDRKEVKLEQMKLEDGVTTIEAEVFEAEYPVNIVTEDGQLIPLPVGEYILENGQILVVVEEGLISEIKDAEVEEEEQPMEEEQPVAASEKPTERPAKSVIESVVRETKFSAMEKEIEDLKALVTELTKQFSTEEKEETVKPIVPNPEKVSLSKNKGTKTGIEKFFQIVNK